MKREAQRDKEAKEERYKIDNVSYSNIYNDIVKEYGKFKTIQDKLYETIENPTSLKFKHKDLLPVNQIKSVTIQLDPSLDRPIRITNVDGLMGSNIFQSIISIAENAAKESGQSLLDLIFESMGIINPADETLKIKQFSKSFLEIWKQLKSNESILKISRILHELFNFCYDNNLHVINEVPSIEVIRKWLGQ